LVNFFLSFLMLSFASESIVPDDRGWVPVRPLCKAIEEDRDESEKVDWVVFSKAIGGEVFFISFPRDPVCTPFEEGVNLEASVNGEVVSLEVRDRVGRDLREFFEEKVRTARVLSGGELLKESRNASEQSLDLFYKLNDKWVWEKVFVTESCIYAFRTTSGFVTGEIHQKFTNSFGFF